MKSDLVDIECYVKAEKERAIAIWDGVSMMDDGMRQKWVWLPRSQIEIEPNGKTWTVTMPEWLAFGERFQKRNQVGDLRFAQVEGA